MYIHSLSATIYPMDSTQHVYIAVIDDDDSICLSMSRLLRAAHFQPVSYRSAEAFLTDKNRPKFGCLVLDIQLQGMSGLDLSKRLLAVQDNTPVVFITAQDNSDVRAQAEAANCAGYFRKINSGADVLAAIRRAVNLEGSSSSKDTQ